MSRPSQPLRVVLALALVFLVASLAVTLLNGVDAVLSLWQKLDGAPGVVRIAFLVLLAALALGSAWAVWRLLRPRAARAPKPSRIDRATLEQRIERAGDQLPEARLARAELLELDRRRAASVVQLALFGEVSAGKSSLLRALAPGADAAVGVATGTTTTVMRHRGRLPDGTELEIADVPGLHEPDDREHAALAAAEAARSHAVLFVADGDLTRAQDGALRALAGYGRPLVLLLNKIDRYRDGEVAQLLARLRQRYDALGVRVLAVSAGGIEPVTREYPDGRQETLERARPAQLGELPELLSSLARLGPQALEPGREAALFAHVEQALAQGEAQLRERQSQDAVTRYTRRAMVGALAAVAPGTDLIIQGALGSALLRELCSIHGLRVRDIDLDDFLARAGGVVRTTTSVTLAVVGNALKAFPGFGTLGGGLLHAVAYGLIFDSLGRAAAQTLAATAALDRDATIEAFRREMEAPAAERIRALASIAIEAWREQSAGTTRPEREGTRP